MRKQIQIRISETVFYRTHGIFQMARAAVQVYHDQRAPHCRRYFHQVKVFPIRASTMMPAGAAGMGRCQKRAIQRV